MIVEIVLSHLNKLNFEKKILLSCLLLERIHYCYKKYAEKEDSRMWILFQLSYPKIIIDFLIENKAINFWFEKKKILNFLYYENQGNKYSQFLNNIDWFISSLLDFVKKRENSYLRNILQAVEGIIYTHLGHITDDVYHEIIKNHPTMNSLVEKYPDFIYEFCSQHKSFTNEATLINEIIDTISQIDCLDRTIYNSLVKKYDNATHPFFYENIEKFELDNTEFREKLLSL